MQTDKRAGLSKLAWIAHALISERDRLPVAVFSPWVSMELLQSGLCELGKSDGEYPTIRAVDRQRVAFRSEVEYE